MRIGLIQQANVADFDDNMSRLVESISECAGLGAEVVVMQELHNTLYFCQTEDPGLFDAAESIPGTSTMTFGLLAKHYKIVIVLSLFEKCAPGVYYNTAVVLDRDGTIAGRYRKMHIPDDPGYYEKFYFTPGDLGFAPIATSIGKLGVMVCWDQWFPEAARLMALRGADILIYPTAIGSDRSEGKEERARQYDAWVTIQRSHAIANGLPVVSVNRTGFEASPAGGGEGIHFWGGSFVAGPQGEVLGKIKGDVSDVLVTDIPDRVEAVRRIWPFFRDRRTDAYDGLAKRYIEGNGDR
ncbi:MAG: carbon-nitrogen hydrolase [Tannerellaceae bacterium]|nr:carbon-nitrogen hydrolase [Tannerellaceae bacterium]